MIVNQINGIDFVHRISKIAVSYERFNISKNFFDDNRSEFRSAIRNVASEGDGDEIYHALSASLKQAEKTILINLYTTAEQMMKETKYHLLGFDDTESSKIQSFLNHKLNPEKFSPNAKVNEISNFFKRYNSSALLCYKLDLYDEMIKSRHAYAHSGNYNFDISLVPKIIDILYYLEFEYRMFLSEASYCKFLKIASQIKSIQGKKNDKQNRYDDMKLELRLIISETIRQLPDNITLISGLGDLLQELLIEDDIDEFKNKLESFCKKVQNTYC